jgi:Zn-dependent protease
MNNRRKSVQGKWKSFSGLLAVLVLIGGKLKFLLPLLKLGKVGGTVWSMMLMMGAYALIYPWSFAVGVVIMILIHEMGHVLAAKQKGFPVSAPAFIPFLGALITLKKQPADAATEAYLAFGGPLVGTVGAILALGLGAHFKSPALLSIAQVGFFLNLINLIPIHPLDGGRIVTAVSRWLWLAGLIGGLAVIIYLKALLFLLIWGYFAWQLYKKYVRKDAAKAVFRDTKLPIRFASELFTQSGVSPPAEAHQRNLWFKQLCEIYSQKEVIHIDYPGLGKVATIPFDLGLVHQVKLQTTKVIGDTVECTLNVNFQLYPEKSSGMIQDEDYYQVPVKTRWIYGVSYFALAAFLMWMMSITFSLFTPPPIIG